MFIKNIIRFILSCLMIVSVEAKKPNVILIMLDDVSWEAFGYYGAQDYKTPHIDALASQGVRFTHCYSTPICTTSRVMIMSGQYNFRNYTHFGYLNPKDRTFGHMMQSAGYKTAIAGKWQLNGLYNRDYFKDSGDNSRPHKAGFDEYCLWQLTTTQLKKPGSERFWSPTIESNGKMTTSKENEGKYGPDIMSDFLCDFIERHQNEPFFVYYPSVLVHSPFVPTPDTIGEQSRGHSANKGSKGQSKKNFVAMVQYADKLVGKIVAKVEEVGQLDNTLILFTADNGTHSIIKSKWNGQEIKGGKATMTDMGTHVPLVVYWKGKTAVGKDIDDLVDFTDIYPTIAEACGVRLTEKDPVDGRSFFPQAIGNVGNPRNWTLCYYEPYWNKSAGIFARTANYKLYSDGRFFKVPVDLKEQNNLAQKITDEQVMATHKRLNEALKQCPPLPGQEGNKGKGTLDRNVKERPIYPDWKNLHD